ncbi:MAG TPA: polyprenyl diphosphate synthase [Elusimicrobiota bacterium]|jgi:undecaprenyl diphosphate synthase|nr:polyprenyl diphosphate synthase [Elusimicrobiota bacterium]
MPTLAKRRPAVPTGEPSLDALEARLDRARIPRHVAVIMDGNGRWAKSRGLPRLMGHRAGAESVREIVRAAGELGIGTLTLYAFSTENWQRSPLEVQGLMRLLVHTLRKESQELHKNGVRLHAVGRTDGLPAPVRKELERTIEFLSANRGLHLNLALNYGGRQEIVDAARAVARAGESITEESIARHLYTAHSPDPDLVVRTSGEFRLSNFLLWQSAYAEIHVTPTYWPDFRRRELVMALLDYQRRERRFGAA